MFKKLLTQLIVVLSLVSPTFAVEIDLTQFASGDTSTHSHIYTQKYDSSNHWQECNLCGIKKDMVAHTLSTKDTHVATCHSSNKRASSCSACSYSENKSYVTNDHNLVLYAIFHNATHNKILPEYKCSKCAYYITDTNLSIPAYYTDGTVVDWQNLIQGASIVREGSTPLEVTTVYVTTYAGTPTADVDLQLSNDKRTLTVSGKIYFPSSFLSAYEQIKTKNLEVSGVCYNDNFHESTPLARTWVYYTVTAAHLAQGWAPISATIPVCDMTRDTASKPAMYCMVQANYKEGLYYHRLYTYNVTLNATDLLLWRVPSITEARVS